MDKNCNSQTWVGNMYQRFEAVCQEVDEFVNKDTVKYVENHMQTVGKSVKDFYSGVVQDILPPLVDPVKNVAQAIPSKQIDLIENYTRSIIGIKENTMDINVNKSSVEESLLVPHEKCPTPSITGIHHEEEQIGCSMSGYAVEEADTDLSGQQEGDGLMKKTLGQAVDIHLNPETQNQEKSAEEQSMCKDVSSPKYGNSSETSIYSRGFDEKYNDDHQAKISNESLENHLGDRSFEEEEILCNIISESDASVFENADWGIENIFLKEGIEKVPVVEKNNMVESVPVETLVSGLGIRCPQEERPLHNHPVDEFECDSNTSSTLQSSRVENSIGYYENKDNEACHVISSSSHPAKLHDISSSSFTKSLVEPDTFYCNSPDLMGCFSVSSHGLSSSESFPSLGCDKNDTSTRLAVFSHAVSQDPDDATRIDDTVSGTGLCRSKYAQPEACIPSSELGAEDSFSIDVEDLNMETIDLSDKKKLVENCVVVDSVQPYTFSSRPGRSKSYKKIIQDAFASRKRLSKEYKQLAIWYGDIDSEFSHVSDSAPTELDSEWELL